VDEYIDMLGRNPLFAEEGGVRTGINHEPETETMVGQGSETRVETRPETRPETVRLFDLPAAAGTGIFMDSDSYEDFEADYAVPKDADFAVRISGDSMAPRFVDGQIVFVRSQQTIEQGEYGIFGLNGSSYIKKMGDGELISLNRRYHPIPIGEFDSFKVFGKVVG
jgi:SOS-response transcriptional repressor LexA